MTVALSSSRMRADRCAAGHTMGNDERRKKMMYAREYIEGWCDSREHITLSDLDRLKDMFP